MVFVTSVDARILLPKKRQVKADGEANGVSAARGKAAPQINSPLIKRSAFEKIIQAAYWQITNIFKFYCYIMNHFKNILLRDNYVYISAILTNI
jgi:hypothetical protein